MICLKLKKIRLALAGVLLVLAMVFIVVSWDSFLLWRIQKHIAGYSQDNTPFLVLGRLKSVASHARYLRSTRTRNTVMMLNTARTFLANTEAGKTNEAYIAFVHLKSLMIRGLEIDGIPSSMIVSNLRTFAETNAYEYAMQLKTSDADFLAWQSHKETTKRREEAKETDELLRKLNNMALEERIHNNFLNSIHKDEINAFSEEESDKRE
jgi:succinate dehydrogenase flavin-adding protein (antitoxin of CptAB toxin-antitoxin module)